VQSLSPSLGWSLAGPSLILIPHGGESQGNAHIHIHAHTYTYTHVQTHSLSHTHTHKLSLLLTSLLAHTYSQILFLCFSLTPVLYLLRPHTILTFLKASNCSVPCLRGMNIFYLCILFVLNCHKNPQLNNKLILLTGNICIAKAWYCIFLSAINVITVNHLNKINIRTLVDFEYFTFTAQIMS